VSKPKQSSGSERAVRARAARALDEILDSRAPADSFLATAAGEDPRDRRFLRELVLGSLRWLRRLDWVIEAAARRPVEEIDRKALSPLRLGVYQLLFLDRVPSHAAVDEAVADARRRGCHRGTAGFVNAVLRRVAAGRQIEAWPVDVEDPIARLAIEESHPEFLVRRWIACLGESRTRALLAANNTRRPLHLLCLDEPEVLIRELAEEGVRCERSELAPRGLKVVEGEARATPAFRRGAFYIQDAASQAAAVIPPPDRGERVLDSAAAPGGKSFSLTSTGATIRVTALDRSLRRLGRLRENQSRLGRITPITVADAALAPFAESFDRVVADLPCSGTGTLARHPELRWRLSDAEFERLAKAGLRMLAGLVECVRPGGLLIAITCSIEAEENDEVVAELLASRPRLTLVTLEKSLLPPLDGHVAGLGKWQVLPTSENDGFTVHALRRT